MCRLYLVIFGLFVAQSANSQNESKPYFSAELTQIDSATWIDGFEITVDDWREFIYYNDVRLYLQLEDITIRSFDYVALNDRNLPDKEIVPEYAILFQETQNLGWGGNIYKQRIPVPIEPKSKNNPHGHAMNAHYAKRPIVGITYQQALDFCKWRTSRDSILSIKGGGKPRFKYRLPSPEEIDKLNLDVDSIAHRNDPKKAGAAFNYKGAKYRLNPKKKEKFEVLFRGIGMAPIHVSFFSEKNGMYNIQGNVAEMTSVEGISMGGSFNHSAKDCRPGIIQKYSSAASWLGFRCVAELVEF